MNVRQRLFIGLCFSCVLHVQALAQAPVVDESESFAATEEPANRGSSVAVSQDSFNSDEEWALAQDTPQESQANSQLLDRIANLEQEIQTLRGQVEVQDHVLKTLQQGHLNKEASAQPSTTSQPPSPNLTPKESNVLSAPPKSEPLAFVRSNPADEQISYLAAYDLVKTKHFDAALTAMETFISRYPQSGYTANAHYWLGELYMVKNRYNEAIAHFKWVLEKFPTSSKTAASHLKIGYALAASGQVEEAKIRLQEVLRHYPGTPTAQLATTKLESLGLS